MSTPKHIAFLGLGMMGGPMAGHLLKAGHKVTGYNRTGTRAQAWLERFGPQGEAALAGSPGEAAENADVVITCVGNDQDLAQVLLGSRGALAGLPRGGLVIDHTTVSAGLARQLSVECADRGFGFVDAPVSGGQSGAENGALAIMCGGTDKAMKAALPIMEAYGSRIVHVGAAGAGQTTKMVNQICIAGVLSGLSEGIRFAESTGLDMDRVLEVISGGAAQSWQMDNRWSSMVEERFDFGFAIDWMRKDLGYALEEGRRLGVSLPITALVDQFYADVQRMDGGRQDTSALIRRFPKGHRK
jgi:3-hydroxyisobutyrate dehydrogenase